jgi:hypothetical protein
MTPAPPESALAALAVLTALAFVVIWITETLLALFQ